MSMRTCAYDTGTPQEDDHPTQEPLLHQTDDKAFMSLLDSELARVHEFYLERVRGLCFEHLHSRLQARHHCSFS